MNSIQYEELCRFFLADKLRISIKEVRSVTIPSPIQPDLPEYNHQIDLYWEGGDELTRYVNIANAKWRSSGKVEQGEVLLLQQVKVDIPANKAMMITNIGFTKGAEAVAKKHGIALHIVCPSFDHTILDSDPKNREAIQTQFQKSSTNSKPYTHEIVHRAFEFETSTAMQSSVSIEEVADVRSHSNRMIQSHSNRIMPSNTKQASRGQGRAQQGFTRNRGGRPNRGR